MFIDANKRHKTSGLETKAFLTHGTKGSISISILVPFLLAPQE